MGQKRLVLGFNKTTDKEEWTWWVEEQSHREKEFGKGSSDSFRASNGVTLYSRAVPEWAPDWGPDCLFVRGFDKKGDRDKGTMSSDDMEKVEQAVNEYNEFFKEVPFRVVNKTPCGKKDAKVFEVDAEDFARVVRPKISMGEQGKAKKDLLTFEENEKRVVFHKSNVEALGWEVLCS